ncbi:MAG: CheR family methyltransferase [Phycisphaerales bacterium JB059]
MPATRTPEQFSAIAAIARARWGLNLSESKLTLVQNRLSKFVLRSPYESVERYLEHLTGSPTADDMLAFFDLLSTNTTSFFREMSHFHHLERVVYPRLADARPDRKLRVWSAACSSGAEPYSLAIHLHETFAPLPSWDVRILGTDLSRSSIETARRGVYPERVLSDLPAATIRGHFDRTGSGPDAGYRVKPHIRSMVSVQPLNLMDRWPMKGAFDIIFLRNVMIYFDLEVRTRLVRRMRDILAPDGILFIGSAETLSGMDVGLRSEIPSAYTRVAR